MLFYILCAIEFAIIVYFIYYTIETRQMYKNWRTALLKDLVRIGHNSDALDRYIDMLSTHED